FLLLAAPAFATTKTKTTYNVLSELPPDADSIRGYDKLAGHFERGQVSPVFVVLRAESSLWDDSAFRAINDVTVALGKVPGVAIVRSLTQPTGGVFSQEQLESAGVSELLEFPDRLQEGANGVGLVIDGLAQIRDGLVRMRDELPALSDGLEEGAAGIARIRDGIREMRSGITRLRSGLTEAADGLSQPGPDNDLGDQAGGAAAALRTALPTSRLDPSVIEAYGRLTGKRFNGSYALPDQETKEYADAGGLEGLLRTISDGLHEAIDGLGLLDGGLVQVDEGLAKLGPGLQDGAEGVDATVSGVARMIDGLDQIVPGLQRLRAGLAEGASRVRSAGIGDILTAGNLGLTPALVESIPGLREQLSFFISEDEKQTRLLITLDREPYAAESLDAVTLLRQQGRFALNDTVLEDAELLATGSAAFFDDIRQLSSQDLKTIIIAVLIGIFVVLALLLRSIVAPLYLILTVLLSLLATLGLTTLVFQIIAGQPGVAWWLPPFLFVMLVALGADYNIFLMSRIREEARQHTTADATARGLALTGHVITSAGLILAGTFGALLLAPLRSLQQYGFAVTVGILLDTFVVRSLLVPSIAVILGRHNWWPSRRAHAS
ncbi:MAG TPA: MMPL family transporter, partial [Actinomycetota bacterium]|nr:MMPL family transporter [Actinomycetota bacterium]